MSATNRLASRSRPCIELLDEAIVEVLRGKTSTERMAMIFAANRTMRLQCTVQDGQVWLTDGQHTAHIEPARRT